MTKHLPIVAAASGALVLGAAALLSGALSASTDARDLSSPTRDPPPHVSAASSDAPEEHGHVRWRTDYDAARDEAKRRGLPLLVLFNEVPGCSTVRGYANTVLTHPLVVEAAETLFVPVLVRNNVGGREREVLERYGEPTWNNPVLRIVDADERALAPRLNGDYGVAGTVATMTAALKKAGRPVPTWLALVEEEELGRAHAETATLSMVCFWSGEVGLSEAPGVLETRPGFQDGHEVVEVTFDRQRASLDEVVEHALTSGAADQAVVTTRGQARALARLDDGQKWSSDGAFRFSAKDDKYQLSRSRLRLVPMTPLQATRVNAAVGKGRDPRALLSPRQLALSKAIAAAPHKAWPRPAPAQPLATQWARSVAVQAR